MNRWAGFFAQWLSSPPHTRGDEPNCITVVSEAVPVRPTRVGMNPG